MGCGDVTWIYSSQFSTRADTADMGGPLTTRMTIPLWTVFLGGVRETREPGFSTCALGPDGQPSPRACAPYVGGLVVCLRCLWRNGDTASNFSASDCQQNSLERTRGPSVTSTCASERGRPGGNVYLRVKCVVFLALFSVLFVFQQQSCATS